MQQGSSTTNLSFTEMIDQRDVQAIDRSVARVEAAKAQGIASTRLDIDDPDGQPLGDPEEADEVSQNVFGLDDYDDGALNAPTEPKTADDASRSVNDRIRRVLDAKALHGMPKRRKLGEKAPPQQTDYTNNKLVVKAELKRLKTLEAEAAKKKRHFEKMATAQAVVAIASQPELTHDVDHRAGAAVVGGPGAPHVSHDMRQFASADAVIIFCDTCGRWQRHGAGRSKLGEPCATILEGMKSQRKLLRHQIVPVTGAKLPASVKTSGGTKCQTVIL